MEFRVQGEKNTSSLRDRQSSNGVVEILTDSLVIGIVWIWGGWGKG